MKFGTGLNAERTQKYGGSKYKMTYVCPNINVTVYGKTGHNVACVNIEKRSIDFLKMYCFKRPEGNG